LPEAPGGAGAGGRVGQDGGVAGGLQPGEADAELGRDAAGAGGAGGAGGAPGAALAAGAGAALGRRLGRRLRVAGGRVRIVGCPCQSPLKRFAMSDAQSDALVFFGATGDLAYKKIFPALQAMARRGHLNVAVIGVAKSGWNLDQFKARARDSVEKHGGLVRAAFDKLSFLLRYVDGDYQDPATFQALRKELGTAQRPAHYLAIPPVLFGTVVDQLGQSGCAKGARVIVEKPFGRDLASAQALNCTLLRTFNERAIFRIDHYL